MIDSCDNQWPFVFSFVANTRAEEGVNFLREKAPSKGVDVRSGLHVEERHGSLVVIRKDPHNLRFLLERKTDRRGV